MGTDADAVGREVSRRREAGERVAGFVGSDRELATAMGEEMLGGPDEADEVVEVVEVVEVPPTAGP